MSNFTFDTPAHRTRLYVGHVIVFNEAHLRRILSRYFECYREPRPRLWLSRNAPAPRKVEPPEPRRAIVMPEVSWPHHRCTRVA